MWTVVIETVKPTGWNPRRVASELNHLKEKHPAWCQTDSVTGTAAAPFQIFIRAAAAAAVLLTFLQLVSRLRSRGVPHFNLQHKWAQVSCAGPIWAKSLPQGEKGKDAQGCFYLSVTAGNMVWLKPINPTSGEVKHALTVCTASQNSLLWMPRWSLTRCASSWSQFGSSFDRTTSVWLWPGLHVLKADVLLENKAPFTLQLWY